MSCLVWTVTFVIEKCDRKLRSSMHLQYQPFLPWTSGTMVRNGHAVDKEVEAPLDLVSKQLKQQRSPTMVRYEVFRSDHKAWSSKCLQYLLYHRYIM